jgi:hypothetical protein
VPPEQCPECGRPLRQESVSALPGAAAPCPGCGTELPLTSVRPPDLGADPGADGGTSVRPPDLRPDAVRDLDDPVAGWDAGVPIGIAAVRDERPFPLDTVVVVAATVAGAALGAALGRRPVRDALLGGAGGAIGAGVVRRIWRLP